MSGQRRGVAQVAATAYARPHTPLIPDAVPSPRRSAQLRHMRTLTLARRLTRQEKPRAGEQDVV